MDITGGKAGSNYKKTGKCTVTTKPYTGWVNRVTCPACGSNQETGDSSGNGYDSSGGTVYSCTCGKTATYMWGVCDDCNTKIIVSSATLSPHTISKNVIEKSYSGSNYINEEKFSARTNEYGKRSGNGYAQITLTAYK